MYNQIIDSLNNHIEKDLRLSIDQKKILQKKHKLSLSDSLDKGHWTTNLCLISSNFTKKSPKELAKNLSSILQNLEGVEKTEIAGPGFLNIFLTQRAFLNQIDEANKDTNLFTRVPKNELKKIQIEFVSANPTGPLHVGHGRGAAYGDAIARILSHLGHEVEKEYYINDAGRQINILVCSIFLRKFNFFDDKSFPKSAYRGNYIKEIAESTKLDLNLSPLQKSKLIDNLPDKDEEQIDELIERIKSTHPNEWILIKQSGLNNVLESIRDDLKKFKVNFDHWLFESSMGKLSDDNSEIFKALDSVKEDHSYKKDGAVWFESTKFGDDKDRVIIRDDGRGTYFSADLAYHKNKLDRGFDNIINVWGSDHHGYIKRIEASIEAMGYNKNQMKVQLVQFANLFKNGVKIKMSTRSGNFYTLKQLIEDIGPDASRFYYLSKQADQHLDFDIDIAKSNSKENHYYYVQYAHARICSIEKKFTKLGKSLPKKFTNMDKFHTCDSLLQLALNFQFLVKASGRNLQPHLIIYFLRDLAQGFNHFYNETNILKAPKDEQINLMRSLMIVKDVIATSFKLIGIEPLEKM